MRSYSSPEIGLRPGECVDRFMEGRLRLIQSRDGYRFSIDAVLLSQFVTIKPGDLVVDLGTGCGIIPLILLLRRPVDRVFGLEIQEELASQAMRNVLLNGFGHRMGVILGDIRSLPMISEYADVVICNPPYRKVRSGRLNPDQRRAIARHEILASLDDILRAARDLLKKKGRLALVYPAVRITDILVRLRRFGMEPKRLQLNYPDLESGAKLALIEACLGGRPGLELLPPLMDQGDFSILSRA
ncbi:MAG: methyltransferase [Deltaproteobacteria bacterium]|nr:methyltransferase [Deltaproteobacteria bacterium]MBW2112385.1 methyltransferase [Deltaproteobacteria bacterium]MBW2352581.1 methyltransferase [Deltaproteobacteria bacterium]HDZ90328.1 methyltransferase domain-containing protein [Deltaproteobacteria bacterium]